jgi:hypothetical protein
MASRLHLRPATRARDVAYLDNHVLAALGDRSISHISKEEVQTWVQFLAEDKGLAPRTVRECYRVLASMMREAVDSKLVPESPCRRRTIGHRLSLAIHPKRIPPFIKGEGTHSNK